MLTDLEIVNSALGRLNCERITSLSDNNKRARLANDFLTTSKLVTLEMTSWDFATKDEVLYPTGKPPFKWAHSYSAPTDLVKIISEYNEELYERRGSEIYSNASKLYITYVYEIDETVKRTPNFDKAWYLNLAAEMAYSLTQNNNLKAELLAEADLIAGKAMSLNSAGSSPKEYEFDAFIDPRL